MSDAILTHLNGARRAVVGHMGSRDHYQLALALAEAGYLTDLVTDVYFNPALARALAKFGPAALAAQAQKRSREGLELSASKLLPTAFAASLLQRAVKNPARLFSYGDRMIGLAAFKKAKRTGSSLYLYSYYAYEAFIKAELNNIPKILFQLHPHPRECKALLSRELEEQPQARQSIMHEREMSMPDYELEQLSAESELADHVVVASTFTKNTLINQGVSSDRISVVPYGVDVEKFPARTISSPQTGALRIAFVGSFVQRKGVSYLLDALKSFSNRQVRLVVITRSPPLDGIPSGPVADNVEFHFGLEQTDMVALLHTCHLFVLPSLAEGFGLAITEAMACGLPVIATPHTCAPDLVENGSTGYIVPIRNSDSLRQAIATCLERRSDLYDMGAEASKAVRKFTWKRFREGLVQDYESFWNNRSGAR